MATEWYIHASNGDQGPISSEALKQLAVEGKVMRDTLVKKGASGNWVAASHVKGLFAPQEETPQPLVPARADGGEEETSHPAMEVVPHLSEVDPQSQAVPLAGRASEESRRGERQNASTLAPCLDCGKPISRLASICPNCGRPVIESHQEPELDPKQAKTFSLFLA